MSARKKKKKNPPKKKKVVALKEAVVVEPEMVQKKNFLPYLLLLLIPFILYGSSIAYEYVLDDKIVLSENNFVKQGLSGVKDIFTTESFTGFLGEQKDLVVGARYRPLSIATFAIEYEISGLNPKVSHFINILLYALTGLLLFRILSLFWKPKNGQWYLGIPFIASLLFILHPIHTEVVANIKSRDEILALLLALSALYYTYRFVVTRRKIFLLVAPIVFLLALLAKENAITFLAVVPITLYFFAKTTLKKAAAVTVPLLLGAIVFVAIRYQVVGYFLDSGKEVTGLMNNPFLGTSVGEKFATIAYTLGLYLKLLVFPHPLTHDYYPYQVPIMNWGQIGVIISLLLYLVMMGYAFLKFKKKSITVWSILFFVATLSIVSNLFFSIGTFMNERFMYMPSIAFTVLLSYWLIEKLPGLLKKAPKLSKPIAYGLLLATVIGYGYKTMDRVPDWKSELALNRAASTVSVNSARANQFMAYSLYKEAQEVSDLGERKKIFDEATTFVDRALRIHPTYPDANNCKAGLVAGYYQIDRDLKKVLDGFYVIQMRKPVPFVDTYLNYLDERADKTILSNFYRQLGTDLVIKGNKGKGNYYLRKASQ